MRPQILNDQLDAFYTLISPSICLCMLPQSSQNSLIHPQAANKEQQVSSHQGAEGSPGGLGHPEVIQDPGEDGSLLCAVDLQGAGAQDLHPVQVQRGGQVVRDLAAHGHNAAGAALSEGTRETRSFLSLVATSAHCCGRSERNSRDSGATV